MPAEQKGSRRRRWTEGTLDTPAGCPCPGVQFSQRKKKEVKTAHLCGRFLPTAAAAEVGLGHFLLLLSAGPPSPRRSTGFVIRELRL